MTCNDHRREKQELVEELMDPKNDSKPVPVLAQVYKFVRYNYFLVIFLSAIVNKYCSCIYRYN